MYCPSSASNVIVATYPGRNTGDTIYLTATGDSFTEEASCGSLPRGYRWARSFSDNVETYRSPINLEPEKPPKKHMYVRPPVRTRPWQESVRQMSCPVIVKRPEFHARSNPRN